MDYLLVAIFAFWIGWTLRQAVAIWKLGQFAKQLEQEVKQDEEDGMIFISIEKYNGQFFVYDKDSNFLAQGLTREEIEKKLGDLFPGRNFACKKDNLREVGFMR